MVPTQTLDKESARTNDGPGDTEHPVGRRESQHCQQSRGVDDRNGQVAAPGRSGGEHDQDGHADGTKDEPDAVNEGIRSDFSSVVVSVGLETAILIAMI